MNAATQAVEPLIRTLEMTGGVPEGFWEDAYVLGFLNGCIGIMAKMATRGKIDGGDLGQVMIGVFDAISGGQGSEIATRVIPLQESEDTEFLRGVTSAAKTISVAYGFPDYDTDPDVVAARRLAKSMSSVSSIFAGPSEAAQVAGALHKMLFFNVVRDRLG